MAMTVVAVVVVVVMVGGKQQRYCEWLDGEVVEGRLAWGAWRNLVSPPCPDLQVSILQEVV